jgi:hypothetical protein
LLLFPLCVEHRPLIDWWSWVLVWYWLVNIPTWSCYWAQFFYYFYYFLFFN